MEKIGLIGAGIMGAGIAQVAAENGYAVIIYDVSADMMAKATKTMQKNWQKAIEKGKSTQEVMDKQVAAVTCVNSIDELKDVDLVIEAVAENMELKKSIMAQLDQICNENTILATNTSTLSITEIAGATKRPDRVVGMHFFNPVPMMQLVEIVRASGTSDETLKSVKEFAETIKKTAAVAKDTPGFIVNRVLTPPIIEAMTAYGDGVASAADIDIALKLGCNWPVGPLALADMIGLDTLLAGAESFVREYGDQKYRPPHVLRQMVRAGELGMKTGKGFYDYKK